jgi:Fe2+ transport system protein FeoA
MTLSEVDLQIPVRVIGFLQLSETDQIYLSSHGLDVGSTVVKILSTPLRDPVECLVDARLLALEVSLLGKILVEP